jgi:predicted dehydrogenase
MQFALLGDHPDGLDMARALVESGRHKLAVYSGPAAGADSLRRTGVAFRSVPDLEEILADPAVDAVIVAGTTAQRPEQLRRALQSERHVLCVQPAGNSPDTAYEAAMIQGDTRQVLLPLLPEALHPGVRALADLVRSPKSGLGALRLLELERWSTELVLIETGGKRARPSVPGWDLLRAVGGEIAEVFAFAPREELDPEDPVLLAGRFEGGGLFQAALLAGQSEAHWRLSAVGSFGRAELLFPQGWPGPARLSRPDPSGGTREEIWETWNPWPALVEVFEEAVAGGTKPPRQGDREARRQGAKGARQNRSDQAGPVAVLSPPPPAVALRKLVWQDAVRSLELDDAARRSAEKRRASALEYQEASEEAGFKGTMTLLGCGLLWGGLLLLILSRWVPWAGWLIAPLFGLFILMQLLRWVIQKPPQSGA